MPVVWRGNNNCKKDMFEIFKNIWSFSCRQVHQIAEEGVSAFYRKVRKLLKLLRLKSLVPLTVRLNINWPEAYYVEANKLIKRYYKIYTQSGSAGLVMKNKIIAYLEKYIARKPNLTEISDWVAANQQLHRLFYDTDQYEKNIHICQRVAGVRRTLLDEHQLDGLNIEFLPRAIAMGSIGPYENLDVYVKAGFLGLRSPTQLILLVDPKSSVNNPCYLNCWRRYITIITDPRTIKLLTPLEKRLTTPIIYYFPFKDKPLLSHRAVGAVREQWVKQERAPILTSSAEDCKRGWDCLRSFGISEDDWFVCLHVREPGWSEHGTTENFRNVDIGTYSLAIKAIVDAGGWVIRIGDASMQPLPQMPYVIDYAHSDAKSDWMDVFLCAQCRFFIGTSSGMFGVALAFGRPLVMTNFLPGQALYYFTSNDIFIPRICRAKNENRTLDFKELIVPPIGMFTAQRYYEKFNLEIIENSSEEIRDVVMEMLARFNGTLQYNEEDERLQDQFRAMTETCSELYGDQDVVVNARMGRAFLRKHSPLLSTSEQEAFYRYV